MPRTRILVMAEIDHAEGESPVQAFYLWRLNPMNFTGKVGLAVATKEEIESLKDGPVTVEPESGEDAAYDEAMKHSGEYEAGLGLPPIQIADARKRHALQRPDGRNNGQYQFVTGYTGGGAEACVHLTAEQIAERCRQRHGLPPGELVDDGTDLWWEETPTMKPIPVEEWKGEDATEVRKTIAKKP